ncbi:hypothetical protein Efla_007151 [Eimeria flavescens]
MPSSSSSSSSKSKEDACGAPSGERSTGSAQQFPLQLKERQPQQQQQLAAAAAASAAAASAAATCRSAPGGVACFLPHGAAAAPQHEHSSGYSPAAVATQHQQQNSSVSSSGSPSAAAAQHQRQNSSVSSSGKAAADVAAATAAATAAGKQRPEVIFLWFCLALIIRAARQRGIGGGVSPSWLLLLLHADLARFESSVRHSLRELRGVACLHARIVFLLVAFAATSLISTVFHRGLCVNCVGQRVLLDTLCPHLNVGVCLLLLLLCFSSPRFARDLKADEIYLTRLNGVLNRLHLFYDKTKDGLVACRATAPQPQVLNSGRLLQLREETDGLEGPGEYLSRYRACLFASAAAAAAAAGPAADQPAASPFPS